MGNGSPNDYENENPKLRAEMGSGSPNDSKKHFTEKNYD